jgi:Coenzyme F420-dependent N5,N10-methylene tetrahydromethanopterin reductase and related flavin-dependent oxidoreductases
VEGLFVWDHVMTHDPIAVADPWIALTAIALATERMRLGAMVTPLARRRPWDVARAVAMLDGLSGGRMVFGAGAGGRQPRRADRLRRGARPARSRGAARRGARGRPRRVERRAGHPHGSAFRLREALVLPAPVQHPRPPVWLGCVWPHHRPLRRAARYDGVFPVSHERSLSGEDVGELLEVIAAHRQPDAGPFDVVITNREPPDAERVAELAAAGATWWVQGFGERPLLADVQAAADAGLPQWVR